MTGKERVLSAIAREGYDRPPCKYFATPEVTAELRKFLGTPDYEALLRVLGDDTREVNPAYCGPELKNLPGHRKEGRWGEIIQEQPDSMGSYGEVVYLPFKTIETVEEAEAIRFPQADWYDYSTIEAQCDANSAYAIITQSPGNMDFINGISRCRGVEKVLFDIADEDPVFITLVRRRFEFFYAQTEQILQKANGKIDIVWCGEDLGNQNGLLISPEAFNKLFAHYYEALFTLVHKYGAKVMMHSCGSVYHLIGKLIDLGLDILDVVQVDCKNMDIRELQKQFGHRLCFSGSISVQSTLPFGTPKDVEREVALRKELFPKGGLIFAPTHNIQVGTPMENIVAMYKAIGSFQRS